MILQRFEVPGLAHYSYLIASEGQAVVIDPQRDFSLYQNFALAKGLTIAHVLETHIHADYASGAPALASATGQRFGSAHMTRMSSTATRCRITPSPMVTKLPSGS